MTTPKHPFTAAVRAPALALPLALLASCTNPLGPIDADYDRRLAPATDRLRSIGRADIDRYTRATDETSGAPRDPAERPPSRLVGLESISVTIEQARAATLANNLDLKVALLDPTIQAERLREEEARFEAVFRPNVAYAVNDNPTFDRTAANQQEGWRAGAGVSVPLRSGGRASIDFTENFSQTNNPFFTFNSSYTSDLTLSLSQPLLRGAGRRVNTYSIRIAEFNRQIGEAATKLEVIRQLANADRAYWVLDALRRELGVRQDEFDYAQKDLARARRLVDAGASNEIEVIRAEEAAAGKLALIIDAENSVLQQQRTLKRIMNMPELPLDSATQVLPATPPDPVPYTLDRAELTRAALDNRMEMLELELRLASDFSSIEYAKNQALPSFILDFRYGIDGLGGTLSDSADQLRGNDFESWSASITGEIPIGNEAAKARIRQAVLARLQRLSTREARAAAITEEVLTAIDRVDSNWQQIQARRQTAILAERTYNAEDNLFKAGTGSSIDLLNANNRLADARSNLIRAAANYQLALVELAFATGTLLGATRVDWSPLGETVAPTDDPTPPAFPFYADPAKAATVPAEGRPQRPAMGH